MKSIAFYIGILGLGTALFSACDVIENPLPAPITKPALSTTLALDSAEAAQDSINGPVTPTKKVLLEDYTGHTCGNCPGAAVMAKNQKALHGDRLVVMAVHANYFARFDKAPYTTNFTTPEGEEWFESFGFISNPNGMVNRVKNGANSAVLGVAAWSAAIAAEMLKTPQISMNLTTLYQPESRKLDIKVRSKYLTNKSGKYSLIVAITEDSIVSYQKNYGATAGGDPAYPVGDVAKYVHAHAMRKVLNGDLGSLNKENPKADDITHAYFTTTLDPAWRKEKCSVVAFIYEEATDEIVQVEEVHLH
ncbi:Omp28-related outer membrane protein [Adhaeribacter sp. BT258]|uniref:Omp28-related outer membrane protein n=1 Tax=Adhaeribacter terrigena TaxID=2793070 RepID=A0ABS1C6H0_9BACT|nr:Omp28-related outer membrane protein [Adhaeribacter terrigena]MBK0404165.1 Omp28-related outer membrane protein [Adhaeribacter terrigena]